MDRRDFLQISAAAVTGVLGCAPSNEALVPPAVPPPTPAPPAPPPPAGARIAYFARFGVDEHLLRETLTAALSRGGDYADVFFQHKVSHTMAVEDGEVNRAYADVALGAGVRVVKGDQTGYAYTEDLSPESLRSAAKVAAAIADGPARAAPQSFRADPAAKPERYRVARPWEDVRAEEKRPLLAALNERALKADARIKKVTLGIFDESGAVLVADSLGRLVEDLQPMTSLWVNCVAEQGGKRESNGYNVAGRTGFEYYGEERLARVVREAVNRTLILFDAVQPPAGELPVVMAAGSSGILLHEAIGHGMEADFNRKNISIFSDKIGKPVAKPFVSIVDDGTVDAARGAINVDDEGNVAGKTVLVEHGTLASYLHDSISAKHYGVAPTGNGRRESYKFAPMPRMRATYMLPGPHEKDEIVRSVKKGIYCTNFTNGQVKIGAGDFTFYVKNGFLIEDGKVTRPIKDVNIIGNGPKVLERIDMVSNDLALDEGGWTCGKDGQSVPVSQGMPTVRVSSITVGEGLVSELSDIVRRAADLARKKGASGASVGAYRAREVELGWRDGRVEKVSEATTLNLGLSLYVDGRYAYVSTSDLRPDALDRFIEDGVALTRTLAPDPFRALPDPSLYQGRSDRDLELLDAAPGDASPDARRAFCREMEAAARGVRGAEAILSVSAGLSDTRAQSARVHTNGFEGERETTTFTPWIDVSVKDADGRRPEDGMSANVRFRADMPAAAALGRQATERALAALGSRKAKSARTTVMVENRAARRLVGALLGPLSARSLQQKQSFLEGQTGKLVGSKILSITDDPLLARGQGSRLWDGDGIAARPRPIIEKGVLRSFYVDVYYGKKLGIPPTTGGASNVVFATGKRDTASLLSDIKDGLWITGFLGGNSNGTTGDYSFGIQGRIVRGGQLAEPFAEMNMSGNQKDLWSKLVAVGPDPYPYANVRTPALMFEGVQVAGL